MTPRFAARRGAEEFNSLVEGTSTEELTATRYAEFLEVVGALRESAPVEPRPEFVADLRHRLMAEAATVLTPTAAKLTLAPRRTTRERRLAIAIGGFAVISATTSMAMAAQSALPGDTLYPLKRALENASTTIRADEDAKGAAMLDHASGRLEEVGELTRSDDADAEAVAETLHAFASQATTASELLTASYADQGQEASIEQLRDFTAESMAALTDLEAAVPESARPALIEATQVVNLIDSAARQVCPSCGDGVTQVPEFASSPLEGLLDDLGVALGAPTVPAAPDTSTDNAPEDPGKGKPRNPGRGPQPDNVPVLPDLSPDDTGGPINPGDNSGNGGNDGGGDPIKDLTDTLTGGNEPQDPDSGGLGDVLEDTVDGVGGVVGGLLGN